MFAQKESQYVSDSLEHKTAPDLLQMVKESAVDKGEVYANILVERFGDNINNKEYYYELAKHFYLKEAYEVSNDYLEKLISIAQKEGDELTLLTLYLKKGHSNLKLRKNQAAIEAYYDALALAERFENTEQEIIAKSGIAIILRRTNRFDKSLEVCRELLEQVQTTTYNNSRNHVKLYTIISEVYLDMEMYDSVVVYTNAGTALSEKLGFTEGIVDLTIKNGMVYYYQKKYPRAFDYLQKAKDILEAGAIKDKFSPTVNTNYFLAACYFEEGSYEKAIIPLHETIESLTTRDIEENRVIASYLLLANCYMKLNNTKEAFYWFEEYKRVNDLFHENRDKTVSTIYEKEVAQFEARIAVMEKEKVANTRTTYYILNASIVALLMLVAVVFVYVKRQQLNKEKFSKLLQKISELESRKQDTSNKKEVSSAITIDDEKVNEVLKRLIRLEEQSFFLNFDCNLRSVAKKVKTNSTYLTKIIKTEKGKNFNDYINDLRIDYVLMKLKNDKKFRSFSIKSIATELGYKTDYSFAKHFKSKTGLYPSYYIRQMNQSIGK